MPTTSTHGISYAASTDAVAVWTTSQNTADSVEAALTSYETINNWVPSWDTTNGGGFTSVGGSGVNLGHYMRIGNWVWAQFYVLLASGFTVDTGTFILVLPVTAYTFGTQNNGVVGNWQARNNSDPYHYGGPMAMWDNTGTRAHFGGSWDGTAPRSRVDSNDPIVWASGDIISGTLNYRAA